MSREFYFFYLYSVRVSALGFLKRRGTGACGKERLEEKPGGRETAKKSKSDPVWILSDVVIEGATGLGRRDVNRGGNSRQGRSEECSSRGDVSISRRKNEKQTVEQECFKRMDGH